MTTPEKSIEVCVVHNIPPKQNTMAKKPSFFSINKDMLQFKIHFFLFIGAFGLMNPFMTIFGKMRIGLSGTELGALMSFQQFLFMLTKPTIGFLADYTSKLKGMIFALMITYGISCFLLLPIPSKYNSTTSISIEIPMRGHNIRFTQCTADEIQRIKLNSSTNGNLGNVLAVNNSVPAVNVPFSCEKALLISFLNLTLSTTNNSEQFDYNKPTGNLQGLFTNMSYSNLICCTDKNRSYVLISDSETSESKRDFSTYQFWLFALLQTITGVCVNSLFTLSDTACCESVEKFGSDFGQQRLYGAVSWGITSVLGGLMYDYTGDFTAAISCLGVMTLISLYKISRLDIIKPQFSHNILKDIGTVLKSKEILAFGIITFFCGIGTSVMWYYHTIFIVSFGASRFLCGLVQGVQCYLGEVPFMFYSGYVIKKLGHFNILSLTLLAYFVRFMWYSYLQDPWWTLPVEIVHGITYGLFYPTLASYAKLNAKPGTEATTQAIIFTTHEAFGAGTGCILFGIGYDYFGGHQMMFYFGIFSGCALVLSLIFSYLFSRKPENELKNKS